MNPLFGQMNQNQIMAQFGTFMKNPMQFLMQRKINIPQQYQNNPHSAVKYLLDSGQMNQETFNRFSQLANQFGIKM